jgi:Mg-chelatase subunit ChlD
VTLLLLVLMILAASDIRMSSRVMRSQRLVLVLDVSSSMAAGTRGTSRLDTARQAAAAANCRTFR